MWFKCGVAVTLPGSVIPRFAAMRMKSSALWFCEAGDLFFVLVEVVVLVHSEPNSRSPAPQDKLWTVRDVVAAERGMTVRVWF